VQAIRGLFGVEASQDEAVVKLEQLKASVGLVRDLFRDKEATEVCCVAAWWGVLKAFNWKDRRNTFRYEAGSGCLLSRTSMCMVGKAGGRWCMAAFQGLQALVIGWSC
jgi:hypothetical protein